SFIVFDFHNEIALLNLFKFFPPMQKFYWISKFLNRVFLKLMMLRNAPVPYEKIILYRKVWGGGIIDRNYLFSGVLDENIF
ncbi:MAG: hypothetical protein J6T20_08375, partial [Treponema sp.]|nr:hypothetical protein [Treponema sp.]